MPHPAPVALSARRGSLLLAWTLLQRSGREALVIFFYLGTLRFLDPAELGLAGLLQIGIFMLQISGNRGLPYALLQAGDATPLVWRAAFWALWRAHLRGALLALSVCALGALVTQNPAWLGYGLCIALNISCFGALQIPQAYLQKNLQFKRLAARSLASTLLSSSLCLALAWAGAGVWSLLLQGIAYEACNLVLTWHASPWRPGPPVTAPLDRLYRFGQPLAWTQAASQAALMTERASLGLFQDFASVGLFQFWRRLGNTYQTVCSQPLHDIAHATLPQWQNQPPRLRRALARMMQLLSSFALLALGLAITLPQPLTHTLLGSQWLPAASFAPGFALGIMPGLVFFGPLFTGMRAAGQSQAVSSWHIRLLILQTILIAAASSIGLLPAVLVLALFPWLSAPWSWRLYREALGLSFRPLARALFPAIFACAAACLATTVFRSMNPIASHFLSLLAGGSLFTATYAVCLLSASRATLAALRRQYRATPARE